MLLEVWKLDHFVACSNSLDVHEAMHSVVVWISKVNTLTCSNYSKKLSGTDQNNKKKTKPVKVFWLEKSIEGPKNFRWLTPTRPLIINIVQHNQPCSHGRTSTRTGRERIPIQCITLLHSLKVFESVRAHVRAVKAHGLDCFSVEKSNWAKGNPW